MQIELSINEIVSIVIALKRYREKHPRTDKEYTPIINQMLTAIHENQ